MSDDEGVLRAAIVDVMRELERSGLNQGTSGNVSVRLRRASSEAGRHPAPRVEEVESSRSSPGEGVRTPPHAEALRATGPRSAQPAPDALLITPSGIPAERLRPVDIVLLELDGTTCHTLAPSSEWRFHRDIILARPEVGAVVHAHPTYATAFAMCREDVPAAHYMVAAAGGPTIRCSRYETFGTDALSAATLEALDGRAACLLANHGLVATGPDLGRALWLATEVETLCRQLAVARGIGTPVILPDDEIARVLERFKSYGPRATGSRPALGRGDPDPGLPA